jgi:hypothetical protein
MERRLRSGFSNQSSAIVKSTQSTNLIVTDYTKSLIVMIAFLLIAIAVATEIAIKSVQAADPIVITKKIDKATAESLRSTSSQITSNPLLSDLAKSIISEKLSNAANQLDPNPTCRSIC